MLLTRISQKVNVPQLVQSYLVETGRRLIVRPNAYTPTEFVISLISYGSPIAWTSSHCTSSFGLALGHWWPKPKVLTLDRCDAVWGTREIIMDAQLSTFD